MLRKGWANISDFSQEKFRLCRKEIFEDDTRRCLHKVHGIIGRIISTKMLVKHSHFRGVLSVLRKIWCYRVLREQLGRILFPKPLACLCERVFCEHFRATTVFLSSFCRMRSTRAFLLLSFSKEGRKTNEEKNSLKFKLNIPFTQIKNKNNLTYKSKFEKNPKSTIKSDIAYF